MRSPCAFNSLRSAVGFAAVRYRNGIETIYQESEERRKQLVAFGQTCGGGFIMAGDPRDLAYQMALRQSSQGGDFGPSIDHALERYREDAASESPNLVARTFWPSTCADAQAPAGGASSSIRDLVKWVILELADGQYEGKQLISKEALEITWTAQAQNGLSVRTGQPTYYGFGWDLDYLEDGVLRVAPSGVFPEGAATRVTLIPSQDLGIVVLENGSPTGVPEALADTLLDLGRYGHVTRDWLTTWKEVFDTLFTIPTEEQIEKYAHPPVPNRPALGLAAYTGTYRNEYVGKVEITAENGISYLTRGLHQAPLPLRHWDGNTFLFYPYPVGENPAIPIPVEFAIGADCKASQITLEELNGSGAGTVTRTGDED